MPLPRRSFLAASGAAVATSAVDRSTDVPDVPDVATAASPLPAPATSGIDHVIVVMRENRSFDHFLGWLPGADGRPAAPTYVDRYGIPHTPHPLTTYQGCESPDPDHSYNSTVTSTLPTICDRLAAKGLRGRYYFGDIPFTALWGTKYIDISKPYANFLADCASGDPAEVSFIDPRFVDEGSGTSGDNHPHADIRSGETFLAQVYDAVVSSPVWGHTMLVVNYDEWGGFFDHVPPTTAPDADPATALRGFWVHSLVVSPRARRRHVAHNTYDRTAVLKAIEWRWGPDLAAPRYLVPPIVAGPPGPPAQLESAEEWDGLRNRAIADGWSLPA